MLLAGLFHMHLSLSPLLIRGKGPTILKTNNRQKSKQTNIFSEPKITSKRIDKYEWSLELCSAPIMTGFQNCNNCAKAIKYRNGMIFGWYLDDSLWIHNKQTYFGRLNCVICLILDPPNSLQIWSMVFSSHRQLRCM